MIDKFLQFIDEAEALAVLSAHNMSPSIQDEDGNAVVMRVHSSKDQRGTWLTEIDIAVVQTPGTYDDQGAVLTPQTMVSGYHVNVRLDGFDIDFGAYDSNPDTPQRIFS